MPLYDYTCSSICGDFEAWRTMAEVSQPLQCPRCQSQAIRIFIAPNINLSGSSLSSRFGVTSEPRLVQRQEQMPRTPKNQSPKGGRPWMLGHAPERL